MVMVGQERAGITVCVQALSPGSATAALRVVMLRAARPVCVAAHSAARVAAVVVHAAEEVVVGPMAAATTSSRGFIPTLNDS